jgi:hypothetical protein
MSGDVSRKEHQHMSFQNSSSCHRYDYLQSPYLFLIRLQFYIATYMNNNIANIPQALQKSGHLVKAIQAQVKSKKG